MVYTGEKTAEVFIYGLNDDAGGQDWGEATINWNNAPANNTGSGTGLTASMVTELGSITPSVAGDTYPFSSTALLDFLNADTDGVVTFIVAVKVYNTEGNDNFASRENTTYDGPTLTLATGADETAPTLVSTTPDDDDTGVAVGSNLVATFDEAVQAGTGDIVLMKVGDSTPVETFDVESSTRLTFGGTQVTIDPSADLLRSSEYYVLINDTAVEDLSGNAYDGISDPTAWSFFTRFAYYWDNDGATAGFGTASGTWAAPTTGDATQGWSTDDTGATEPVDVTTATVDEVNFGSGGTGLGAGTITVSGTVDSGDMTFAPGSGAITLSGGTITLGSTGTITVANDTGGNVIDSVLAGAGSQLTVGGRYTLALNGANTYTGQTILGDNTNSLTVQINSLADVGGGPSSLGAPTTAGKGLIQIGAVSRSSTMTETASRTAWNTSSAVPTATPPASPRCRA